MSKSKKIKCPLCGDRGFFPNKDYLGVLVVCNCREGQKLHNADGSLSVDIRKTPDWFRRSYENFVNFLSADSGEDGDD